MNRLRGALKPGWYLLAAVAVYALVATVSWLGARDQAREARGQLASARQAAEDAPADTPPAEPAGLWMPLPGARLPADDAQLPGAPRPYRDGVSQGFDFYDGQADVPVALGTPVVAVADGAVVRADHDYQELEPDAWEALLEEAAGGASETQLDRLRGRQVWLELDDGRVARYAHLASVAEDLAEGDAVRRGRVLGRAGNSGTDDGVAGSDAGVRLHFELWDEGRYFGQGLEREAVRERAAELFARP